MASRAKQFLDTAVNAGKAALSAAEKRLRGDEKPTDRPPSTPGTPAAKTMPKKPAKAKKAKPSGSPAKKAKAKPG